MATNRSQTSTFPSQLSSKCRSTTRKKFLKWRISRWIQRACSLRMVLSMRSLTRPALTQSSAEETMLAQTVTRCWMRSIEFSLQMESTFAFRTVFQRTGLGTLIRRSMIGPCSLRRQPSQPSQHLLWCQAERRTIIRISTSSISWEKLRRRMNDRCSTKLYF